jgi:hypothetical protein
MNFLQAVQVLKDGECEGIRKEGWGNWIHAVPDVLRWGKGGSIGETPQLRTDDLLSDDWQLVNPKPQTEAVEVKRWFCKNCERSSQAKYVSGCCSDPCIVELTGTYERPIPAKVKRREELPADAVEWGSRCPSDRTGIVKYYREWEE